jgi:hypothetical protein
MKVIIDTSSLISLVRYYIPFDSDKNFYDFIKSKIQNDEIIVVDRVYDECRFNAKGLVLKSLDFLSDSTFLKNYKVPYKTENLIIPIEWQKQFYHYLNNDFVNSVVKKNKGINDTEFENLKQKHLEDADMKMIILALNLLPQFEDLILITEESENSNDGKVFNKIPSICATLGINSMTLPSFLKIIEEIEVKIEPLSVDKFSI